MHILLVDDAQDTIDVFRVVLRLQGFTVETANNGANAVQIVQQNPRPFDAILVDVGMPEMNGWEVVKAIRGLPQGQDVFMALFSAYAHLPDVEALTEESGADCLIHKPILPQELMQKINQGIAAKRGAQIA